MNYDDVAIAALRFWRPEDAIIAVAIAAAETGEFHDLHGDPLSIFTPQDQERYRPFACAQDLSHGPWQVFCGVHHRLMHAITQNEDPCHWAGYLEDPVNCAYVAFLVWFGRGGYTPSGWQAWSTFNIGAHHRHMAKAEEAVRRLHNQPF